MQDGGRGHQAPQLPLGERGGGVKDQRGTPVASKHMELQRGK